MTTVNKKIRINMVVIGHHSGLISAPSGFHLQQRQFNTLRESYEDKKKSLELRYASFGIPGAIPGEDTLPDTSECYLSTEPGHESGTKVE